MNEALPGEVCLPVLFEGPGYIVIDKPPGIPVIPGRGAAAVPSVRERLEDKLGQKIYVVHRLDRDTSGVLLMALDAKTHRTLSIAFERGLIEKRYLALVEGRVEAPLDMTRSLIPARRGRMRVSRSSEDGKPAHTIALPVEMFARATLVEASPLTGRTHQIRVHLADAGHPLLVDHQYGRAKPLVSKELGGESDEIVLARTPLHAAKIVLPALEGVEQQIIEAALPKDMAQAIELLRRQQQDAL